MQKKKEDTFCFKHGCVNIYKFLGHRLFWKPTEYGCFVEGDLRTLKLCASSSNSRKISSCDSATVSREKNMYSQSRNQKTCQSRFVLWEAAMNSATFQQVEKRKREQLWCSKTFCEQKSVTSHHHPHGEKYRQLFGRLAVVENVIRVVTFQSFGPGRSLSAVWKTFGCFLWKLNFQADDQPLAACVCV